MEHREAPCVPTGMTFSRCYSLMQQFSPWSHITMVPSQDTDLGPIIKDFSSGGLEWGLAPEILKSLQVSAQPGLGSTGLESRR